eukprot:GHVU01074378.1.p1 GENE.GHVU01074378.1~~GHVU01074378.1.p1  ORF type:complete len:157 (-),score=24.27 GHVU01074378.1:34-504(-)
MKADASGGGHLSRIDVPVLLLLLMTLTLCAHQDKRDTHLLLLLLLLMLLLLFGGWPCQRTAWEGTVAATVQKLSQPLLRMDPDSELFSVNVDHALIELLQEVKYFCAAGLSVPDDAMQLFSSSAEFRRRVARLEVVVQEYNKVNASDVASAHVSCA